jgi:hypothetical protein
MLENFSRRRAKLMSTQLKDVFGGGGRKNFSQVFFSFFLVLTIVTVLSVTAWAGIGTCLPDQFVGANLCQVCSGANCLGNACTIDGINGTCQEVPRGATSLTDCTCVVPLITPTSVGYNPTWLWITLVSLMGAGGFLLRRRTARQ